MRHTGDERILRQTPVLSGMVGVMLEVE